MGAAVEVGQAEGVAVSFDEGVNESTGEDVAVGVEGVVGVIQLLMLPTIREVRV